MRSLILRVSNTSADVRLRAGARKGMGGCLTAQQGEVLSGYHWYCTGCHHLCNHQTEICKVYRNLIRAV